MDKEQELEEITESEFQQKLLKAQRIYLEEITEYTKLHHGCDDISRHINFLHSHNYKINFYTTKDGSITYEYKEKEPIGFRRSK